MHSIAINYLIHRWEPKNKFAPVVQKLNEFILVNKLLNVIVDLLLD